MTVHTRRARPDSPSRLELTRPSQHSQHERPGGAPGGGGQNPGGGGGSLRRTLSTPKDFPRLLELTPEQLGELLTDKEAFARFLHGTEGALEARAFTRDLRLEIEGMARANIEMAEEAADIRSQISVIRAVDMKPVQEEYEAVKARADALVGRYNLPDLLETMKNRAAATDSESEEVNEAWLDGKMSAEDSSSDIGNCGSRTTSTSSRRPSWSRTCRGEEGTRGMGHPPPRRRRRRTGTDARGTERWDASNPKSWARVLEKKRLSVWCSLTFVHHSLSLRRSSPRHGAHDHPPSFVSPSRVGESGRDEDASSPSARYTHCFVAERVPKHPPRPR